MTKNEILEILKKENLARYDLHLQDFLEKELISLYAVFGRHNFVDTSVLRKDAVFAAKKLNTDIKIDSQYKYLRKEEISYLLNEFQKNRFSEDIKDCNLRAIYALITRYLNCPERKEALRIYHQEKSMADEQAAPVKRFYSAEEMLQSIQLAYDAYIANKQHEEVERKCGIVSKRGSIAERDLGGLKKEFLVRNGYMTEEETFLSFLQRAEKNNGKFYKL